MPLEQEVVALVPIDTPHSPLFLFYNGLKNKGNWFQLPKNYMLFLCRVCAKSQAVLETLMEL